MAEWGGHAVRWAEVGAVVPVLLHWSLHPVLPSLLDFSRKAGNRFCEGQYVCQGKPICCLAVTQSQQGPLGGHWGHLAGDPRCPVP